MSLIINGLFVLVAPQGTTGIENKLDTVFSTAFPKSFPTREIRRCIPICGVLRLNVPRQSPIRQPTQLERATTGNFREACLS
jgi:hypothetical protein